MNPETPQLPQEDVAPQERRPAWAEKLAAVLFCIFCLELGTFLLVYPWIDTLWNRNWLFQLLPDWRPVLLSQHFRGAVSGLGILNLFVAFLEIIRLRRFARR
jgi:hypothetical protein